MIDPAHGWVMNTNNWPWTAAGPDSPVRARFPRYMDTHGENPRGLHAVRVLDAAPPLTLEGLRDAAFDSYLPAFATLVPMLVAAYDALPASEPLRARLQAPIEALRGWDDRWAASSVPTTLAVYWGQARWKLVQAEAQRDGAPIWDYLARTTPGQKLGSSTSRSPG